MSWTKPGHPHKVLMFWWKKDTETFEFEAWRIKFRSGVSSRASRPIEAMRCINEIASEKSIAELNRRIPSLGPSCRQTSRFLIQKQPVSTRRSSTETSKKSLYPRRSCTTRETFSHGQTGCVDTTPNLRTLRTPVHVILSRVAQDLSHRVNRNLCVSQNSHSSHLTQHVARALVVVSFTLEHCFTFHMHSSPTFYPTIYPTFVAVHFTWRYTLRGSTECVFRLPSPLAEPHSPTGHEPKDLTEEDTSVLVKPMFFHRGSKASHG